MSIVSPIDSARPAHLESFQAARPVPRAYKPMTAYISQNAFWGLLISAAEVYKRECFGLLIGYRDRREERDMYIVEHALPYQTATRRHKGVASNPRAHRRIERFLRNIPQLSVIGDFHSHTMWG